MKRSNTITVTLKQIIVIAGIEISASLEAETRCCFFPFVEFLETSMETKGPDFKEMGVQACLRFTQITVISYTA